MLAVGIRPYYLPREFSHVIIILVYIPPRADPSPASEAIQVIIAEVQCKHRDALIVVSGDFNHVDVSPHLGGFTQYVDCTTRLTSTLDLCFINIKDAYSSVALPPLGKSDHNLVRLTSTYRPCVMRLPVTTRTCRRWTSETSDVLQDCFQWTEWNTLLAAQGPDDSLEGAVGRVTDYINFCTDVVAPLQVVRCYPNNKPWITPSIKHLLNLKKAAFKVRDRDRIRAVQRDLKLHLRRAERDYKRRLERKLGNNDMKEVWRGMRTITGYKERDRGPHGDSNMADDFNRFFCRFDLAGASCGVPLGSGSTSAAPGSASSGGGSTPSRDVVCSSCAPPTIVSAVATGSSCSAPHTCGSVVAAASCSSSTPWSGAAPPRGRLGGFIPSGGGSTSAVTSCSAPLSGGPISTAVVSCPASPSRGFISAAAVSCSTPPSGGSISAAAVSCSAPSSSFSISAGVSGSPRTSRGSISAAAYGCASPSGVPPSGGANGRYGDEFTVDEVRAELRKVRRGKSAGPDGVMPRVLRDCADELVVPLQVLFNRSLQLGLVPKLWKTSCIVPVPKVARPSGVNDYRPVALTSVVMKTLERLLLRLLGPQLQCAMDPLQFAYRAHMGVEDAILFMLHRALSFLDDPGGYVRLMFFDFSSAFNTINPSILRDKLERLNVEPALVSWINSYLTERPQYVRLGQVVSGTALTSTGAPQGTVLSPFLFTLYTSDFAYRSPSCHIQKYSDDTAVVACVRGGDEAEYRGVIRDFVSWSRGNGLVLNISKTKEMIVDFSRRKTQHPPVQVDNVDIEIVSSYKYLGVHIDNNLDWSVQAHEAYKKGQSRLFFLRRLKSFEVCNDMLFLFYQSVVSSAALFGVVCWGNSMTARDRSRLDKLVRKCVATMGREASSVCELVERRMLSVLRSIMKNESHPLHNTVAAQKSSRSDRLLYPRIRTERYRRSFVPAAMRLFNASL